jgi:hypothetical protein
MIRRVLLVLAVLALLPASAHAAVSSKKAIWGPTEIDGESQFPVYRDLGARLYQMKLQWDQVAIFAPGAPKDDEDPGYEWPDEVDTAIAEAKDNGMQVALTVTGTPGWANGDRAATVAPKRAADYANFVAAAARHYPAVHVWGVWEGAISPAARYPQMLDGAYKALKARSKRNRVIGDGAKRLKLPNGKTARMDLYGFDPSGRKAPTRKQLAKVEHRAGAHKLFLGPVSLPTSRGGAFRLTRAGQASWLKSAFKLVRADAKIATLSYRTLNDELGAPFTGLLDTNGNKKPAYNAYKRG